MTVAGKFGALRMRVPMIACFIGYIGLIVYFAAMEIADSGSLSWSIILMAIVSILCALPGLIINPHRVKKISRETYAAGEENGYYGEVYFEDGAIVKDVGYKQTRLTLCETTMYIETADFMAFTSAKGATASIILPARCLTEENAAMIRKEVFREENRLQRRVIARMVAGATAPIAPRAMLEEPTVLFETAFTYTAEELSDIITSGAGRSYIQKLPSLAVTAMMLGAVMVLFIESVWVFAVTVPAVFLISLLFSSLSAASAAKRVDTMQASRICVTITDRGIDHETAGRTAAVKWQGVKRAVEADTYVEFTMNGGLLLRIPKRAIEDMDAFRAIVDRYHKS